MKKCYILLLLIVFSFVLASCEKSHNTFLIDNGKIIDSWICTPTLIQEGLSILYTPDDYLNELKKYNLEYEDYSFKNRIYYLSKLSSNSNQFLVSVFEQNNSNEFIFVGSAFLTNQPLDSNELLGVKTNETYKDILLIDPNTPAIKLGDLYHSYHYCKGNVLIDIVYDDSLCVIEKNAYTDSHELVDAFIAWSSIV